MSRYWIPEHLRAVWDPTTREWHFARRRVLRRDDWTCQYCGWSAESKAECANLHVDHAWPRALGGTNALTNLFTSCVACNLEKGASIIADMPVALCWICGSKGDPQGEFQWTYDGPFWRCATCVEVLATHLALEHEYEDVA